MMSRYNAIIRPAIRRVCGELVGAAEEAGKSFAVVDAALLLDAKMPFAFDVMIALKCDPEVQMARLMAKGGFSEAQLRSRLAAQGHIEKSFYKADHVVDTGGEPQATFRQIAGIIDALAEQGR